LRYTTPLRLGLQTCDSILSGARLHKEWHPFHRSKRLRQVNHAGPNGEDEWADLSAMQAYSEGGALFWPCPTSGQRLIDWYVSGITPFVVDVARLLLAVRTATDVLVVGSGYGNLLLLKALLDPEMDPFVVFRNQAPGTVLTVGPVDMLKDPGFTLGSYGVEGIEVLR
jgi:hypothetical protein